MATLEEFTKLAEDVSKQFGLAVEKLHDHVLILKVPNRISEVARLIYIEADQTIGMAFQIEVIASDAIQVFSTCRHFHKEVMLLQCFYANAQGEVSNGIDAQIIMEHDRENKYLKVLEARTKAQQEEEFQVKQMEKAGKITFH